MDEKQTKHTPGPWGWFGNAKMNNIYLATCHSGRKYVMSFDRWGMRGAQPSFRIGNLMAPASDLVTFEVGDQKAIGIKAALADESVYRLDINGVACADARLIAAAPDLLAAVLALRGWMPPCGDERIDQALRLADAAIAAATGSALAPEA